MNVTQLLQRTAILITALGLNTSALAQEATAPPPLTIEQIYGSREYSVNRVQTNWTAGGRHYTVVERRGENQTDLYRVAARDGKRELLIRGADLMTPGTEKPISIDDYRFSDDDSKLLIAANEQRIWRRSSKAFFYIWDFKTRKLAPVSGRPGHQQYAKLSPDGTQVAFVRDNNIYVSDPAVGTERALTTDGDENIINGTTDWVYEEELSLVDGFRWSPDGKRIAFWRFDQSKIPTFFLLDETNLYPELKPVRYPKAGAENSQVKLGVIEVITGRTTWIDVGRPDSDFYIARMDFISAEQIWFQRLNRHQNKMELLLADVTTGKSRMIMADTDDAWVDIHEPVWIENGKRFVILSERDGYSQLFLFNRDGTLIRKLTPAQWDVRALHGVDERARAVYFSGAGDGPLNRPLYRVNLDGQGLKRISGPVGTHQIQFDPTFSYYVDTYSSAGVPPIQTLRKADGTALRTLADNTALMKRLEQLELRRPEFLEIPLEDGARLNAWLIKPADFDSTQRYPLLMYVYGGPGSQTVTDAWHGDRYLWHQYLANQGYLVASVDNRGTGGRGVEFKKITYLNLGKFESADQIAAARYFAGLAYVDSQRIGIWGWSYGGYMAALSLFKGGDVFKAGISVAPVTDWRLYDTIYTERYMRTPLENPSGYAESAPLTHADRLQGRFLLVHGTGDDNVHSQNSMQLVERLIQANKQFQFRLYPNKAHGISGPTTRVNLFTLLTDFLLENL